MRLAIVMRESKIQKTVKLWKKVETFEDPEFNRKYYDERDPLKKVQGAKIEVIMNDETKITEQLDFANAHPSGKTLLEEMNI